MGELIELQKYRTKGKGPLQHGLCVEIKPPAVFVQYYENGVLMEQHPFISEYMLRELLDEQVSLDGHNDLLAPNDT